MGRLGLCTLGAAPSPKEGPQHLFSFLKSLLVKRQDRPFLNKLCKEAGEEIDEANKKKRNRKRRTKEVQA